MRIHTVRELRKRTCIYIRRSPFMIIWKMAFFMALSGASGYLVAGVLLRMQLTPNIMIGFLSVTGVFLYALIQLLHSIINARPQPRVVGDALVIPGAIWNYHIQIGKIHHLQTEDNTRLLVQTRNACFKIDGNFFDSEDDIRHFIGKLLPRLPAGCCVALVALGTVNFTGNPLA